MCGICGFTAANRNDSSKKIIEQMCQVMNHRGPDGRGYLIDHDLIFGHCRLSLIDIAGGAQPMSRDIEKTAETFNAPANGECTPKRYSIVFNGEIYNYQDLRRELEAEGYAFSFDSDTEVLLVSYIAWGKKMLNKLRGMFAFAIWDRDKRSLFCARDYFGIKPFYYADEEGQFIFASEIKAILEHPSYSRELNYKALEQYLCFQYSVLDETFFKGIKKLAPGHCLTVEDGEAICEQWWQPSYEIDHDLDVEKASLLINEAVQDSVSYHKIADVEVASFLSSGVDSNYLAASLNQQETNIKTFTVGFETEDGKKYNEISYAEEAADWMGVDNISHAIGKDEFWESVPKVQWHMDEPSADPAAVALWFVDREASKHVKAILSGEGSDELFGGYTIYQTAVENDKLSFIPKPLLRLGAKAFNTLGLRGANYLMRASTPLIEHYIGNAYIFDAEERDKVLKERKGIHPSPQEVTWKYYEQVKDHDETTQMQFIDLNTWLVGDILLKTDKMAMAHSLESRVPFLDKEVWNIARTLPRDAKVSHETSKIALRKAASKIMPEQFTGKRKLGFPVPIRLWLCEDKYYLMMKELFTSELSKQFFEEDYLVHLLDEHRNGKEDNSRKIWCIYAFLVWYREFFPECAE